MTETDTGTQRSRQIDDENPENPVVEADESPSEEMPDAPPTKKRRRGAKANSEKKFECKAEGCDKSYSRAEHLYRHQLNHTPKNIYRCDYPDCNRYFVRQDLCLRHRERHTTNGSQLHKRDVFAQTTTNQSPIAAAPPTRRSSTTTVRQIPSPVESQKHISPSNSRRSPEQFRQSVSKSEDVSGFIRLSGSTASASSASVESRFEPPTPQAAYSGQTPTIHRSNSSSDHPLSPFQQQVLSQSTSLGRQGSFGSTDDLKQQASFFRSPQDASYDSRPTPVLSPNRTYSSSSHTNHQAQYFDCSPIMTNTRASGHGDPYNQNAQSSTISMGSYTAQSPQSTSRASFASTLSQNLNALNATSAGPYVTMPDGSLGMDMASMYAYPVFGGDEYNRSPNAMGEEFTAWFFNGPQSASLGYPYATSVVPSLNDTALMPFTSPYCPVDPSSISIYPNVTPPQHAMSVMSIVDSSGVAQYTMSEEKRQELLDLMRMQFQERPHDAVKKRKDAVFEGDVNADSHILSLRMMHTYVGSYWYHQHAQLPILHKPTFTADKTPNLLLLMVIAIGAATLDKAYGTSLTDSAAEFANFVVWHVRWEIMRDADYRPPAKLWVFQTLLLIEIYEKMYATRALHERGHINHDSLLTLMRRGSSLIGRPPSDSPPSLRGDTARSSGSNSATETPSSEEMWAGWISSEATRRAAFAAFVIDSIHATMFGHSAKMVAHEMRLPLPCDEGLWSATSWAEVQRGQSSLQTHGIKPTMFLDGLKKTLHGQRVRTNSFGRTILMAGLLSVSWHMNQKDLSTTALGAQSFGGKDNWRGLILRAFDNWKRDFDEALVEATVTSPDLITPLSRSIVSRPIDDENIFESRTVLHHIAHMASHVDIVDCQIFAGAPRLLGRSITPRDYSNVREKITERWATRASARDAAFYALKFLAQVLIPPYEGDRFGHASPILPLAFDQNQYYARDDFLLNRPWVLYFSALVVWCYGYALEGPIFPTPTDEQFATPEQRDRDMRDYLDRVGGIRAPDDLEAVKGKNRCLGLLMILKESFSLTRWELTREAANLMGNCINKLKGMDGAGARVT